MFFSGLAWAIALFFAMNIGASGTAASMGSAYGGGAIKKRWKALILVAIPVFIGATSAGGRVVHTISGGIVPSHILTPQLTVMILASACFTLFFANIMRVPLSTSEVTVGAVIGVGIVYGQLYIREVFIILCVWIALPFVSYFIAFFFAKLIPTVEKRLDSVQKPGIARKVLSIFLVCAGCYEAFAAGTNNIANAIGPLVGAGLIHIHTGIVLGALFVSFGAMTLGGRVLETNAKSITKLSLFQATIVSLTSGTLVLIASLFGLPVPLTQSTTMSIFGIGVAEYGRTLWKKGIVKRIITVWIVSPISSFAISYVMIQVFVKGNIIPFIVTICMIGVATGLTRLFFKMSQKRRRIEQEKPGQIL
jgi:sulfate permease